jgi:hypothetical protein
LAQRQSLARRQHPLQSEAQPRQFRVTIADLGDMEAVEFPRMLEDWCRATLEAWEEPTTLP